jgi:hypothetical protein
MLKKGVRDHIAAYEETLMFLDKVTSSDLLLRSASAPLLIYSFFPVVTEIIFRQR